MPSTTRLHLEARVDRYSLKLARELDAVPVPHAVAERLRVARMQAVAQRKRAVIPQAASQVSVSGGSAVLGGEGWSWWHRFASAVPLFALAIGLIAINIATDDERASELAEVDTLLLTDDLPPDAHSDPGFIQFLKFGLPAAEQ